MTRRNVFVHGAAVLGLLAVLVASVSVGPAPIPLGRVAAAVLDGLFPFTQAAVPQWQRVVVLDVRLPRVLLAAAGGGGLAVAGAVLQGLFRNPMADPGVLGVSGGAALGAVCAFYLAPTMTPVLWVPLAAFVGALAVMVIVYRLASQQGVVPVATLLLAGIAAGSIVNALTSLVLSLSLSEWEVGREMLVWLMGGLEGRTWMHLALCAPVVVLASVWLAFYSRDLNALLLGEQSAMGIGVDVRALKRVVISLASLMTAAVVAVTGVLAFVGLVVPHIVRLLVGPDHRSLIPASFLFGSIFLTAADVLCRLEVTGQLRLGVVTSLAGGPFFLFLLVRHRRAKSAWL